jgi:phage-related protein
MAVVVNVYGKASLAQIDKAQAQLAGLRREAAAQAGPWKSMGSAISSTWAKIGSTVAAVAVARWLKGSVDAARSYQLGLAQLRTAVLDTNKAEGGHAAALAASKTSSVAVTSSQVALAKAAAAAAKAAKDHGKSSLAYRSAAVAEQKAELALSAAEVKHRNDLQTLRSAVDGGKVMWAGYQAQMQKVVTTQSQLSAYSRGDLEGALTALTQTTGSASKGLSLLALTTNLARAKHMDLEKAATLVGKVADGNTTALKRYGIVLDKGATATQALAAMNAKFAGAAKTYGDSSAGAAEKFHNSLQQLQITVGTALLPVINRLMGYLNTGLGLFQKLPGPVKTVVVALGALAGVAALMAPFASGILAVGKAMQLAQLASKVWAAAQWLLNAAMDANPIGLVVVAIAALVAAFVIAYKRSQTFRDVVLGAWNAIKSATSSVFNWIVSFFKRWGTLVLAALTGGLGPAVLWVLGHWAQIRSAASDAFGAVVSLAKGFGGRVLGAVGNLGSLLYSAGQAVVHGFVNGITSVWSSVTSTISHLLSGLSKAAKKLLGISSPSKVFADIGRQTAAGLAAGMDGGRGLVSAAAGRMVGASLGGASGYGGGAGGALVVAPGAIVVNLYGADAGGSPAAIGQAVSSAVAPAFDSLAREVRRVVRR